MPLTIIRVSPEESSYTPLSTFQSETPESFSTPVLHYRHENAKVLITKDQAKLIPIFGTLNDVDQTDERGVEGIDLWVTSEDLIFFNKALSVGVTIPYVSLTLHAVQRTGNGVGIYMQLSLTPDISHTSNPDGNDDEELVELSVIPKGPDGASQPDTEAIFKALSVCTSLHSATAPNSDDEEDGEDRILFEENDDEPRLQGFPGGGGWITAENVDQFRFEDADESNVILGPGAGSVRLRDAGEDAIVEDANFTDESKWRRTG